MLSEPTRRALAALLEARTGQELAVNRRWRFEAALAPLLRERGISSLDAAQRAALGA